MDNTSEILNLIRQNGRITLPEIQKSLSLPYKTVRESVRELESKRLIARDGGMAFRYLSEKDFASNPLPKEVAEKRDRIRLAIKKDPRIERLIEECASNDCYGGVVSLGYLRELFRIGFARSYELSDQLKAIGILSSRGVFQLNKEECETILGKHLDSPSESESQEDEDSPRFVRAGDVIDRLQAHEEAVKRAQKNRDGGGGRPFGQTRDAKRGESVIDPSAPSDPQVERPGYDFDFSAWLDKKEKEHRRKMEEYASFCEEEEESEEDLSKEIRNAAPRDGKRIEDILSELNALVDSCNESIDKAQDEKQKISAERAEETPLEIIAKEGADPKNEDRLDRLRPPLDAGAETKHTTEDTGARPPQTEEGDGTGQKPRRKKKKK